MEFVRHYTATSALGDRSTGPPAQARIRVYPKAQYAVGLLSV